jgi:hypothetical protein
VEYSDLMEKKDACYYKVKASAKVWPSAYASGRLVQCRKKGAGNYGNKSESVAEGSDPTTDSAQDARGDHRGEVKKNKDGSYVATDHAGSREIFTSEKAAKAHANSGQKGVSEDKGMTQYNAFKREWRAKHGSDAKVPGYDSKEYNAYWWRQGDKQQGDKKQGVSEQQLDEKCWDGYQQQGMKNKGNRQVPNCVPVTEELTTEQQFDMIEDMVEQLAESHGVDSDVIWEDFESVDDHELYETAAWRRKEGKSAKGGLNAKGVASYRRENPGSKLQTAVTTKPSKLKPGSKAAKRRKSFCARMGGVKGPMKKPNGKPTRKALALRKWNC